MTDRIGLVGTGLLHDSIAAALAERATTITSAPPHDPFAILVVASDAWDTSNHATVRELAAGSSIPWLPVRTELGHAVVGPLEVPQEPGCVACAAARRRRIRPDHAERAQVRQRHAGQLTSRPSSWLTGLAAQLIAAVIAEEISRIASGDAPRTRLAMCRIELAQLNLTRHPFLPDPTCPVCGELADDAPELARITLGSEPAHRPGSYRTRAIGDELESLVETYVDEETGLVRSLRGASTSALVLTSATLGWRSSQPTAGYGRAATFQESRLTALLEALERYASSPGSRRTVVKAAYDDVKNQALDPRTLGLYPSDRYELPGFNHQPFAVDRSYRWVWGWSFAGSKPLLVPESCAYYGAPHEEEGGHGFVYEISNGCALGSSVEEAILYGVLEVAERDAFLLTWYAQLAVPRIDLATASDRTVPLLAAAIGAETGYRVSLFDTTVEQGIPCLWAMAVNPSDDGRPAVVCAAGSHPDPQRAARSALAELGPALTGMIRRYADPDQVQRARKMAADASLVREMEDHSLLYADPIAAARLDFLTDSRSSREIAEIGRQDQGGLASVDLRDNVLEAVRRYTDHGMDVIVVDQTTPEHRVRGLSCVKVLIPGTLSMTFGHQYRRVDGLPRLYRVPYLLGYRDRPLRPDEVNPHPHPFP